jgi:RimJ/RimL family protein N-acetyltransferase/cytidine deaminase
LPDKDVLQKTTGIDKHAIIGGERLIMLETERLILRPWKESDAEDLYRYASNPDVGPIAGWPPHQSVHESHEVIKNVLNGAEAYAICRKEDEKAIGAVELKLNGHTDLAECDDECELGYWLGKPFWGQGIMPEAVSEIIRHGFEDIGMTKIWCGYYEGNTKSKRVQEKVRFRYQWKSEGVDVPLMHEKRTGHVSSITKAQWDWDRLYVAAKAVQNGRKVSDYVEAGGVAAAILSSSGKIYTGVCIDTCCTLGICAERNAIFNMLTNGEQEIQKVIAIMTNGKNGAPCGACRELMVQMMPEKYKDIEIMMDYEQEKVITLGELTPEWWI